MENGLLRSRQNSILLSLGMKPNFPPASVRVFCVLIACLFLTGGSSLWAQPSNDNFANRAVIPLNSGTTTVSGSLSNATSETSEPSLVGISSGQTAWWSWTAPSNGLLTLSAQSASFSPLVTTYEGDQLTSLSLVASNNYQVCYADGDCGCHWRMRNSVSFHVSQNSSYQICLDSSIQTDASIGWVEMDGTEIEPDGTTVPVGLNFLGPVFTTNTAPGDAVSLVLNFVPAPANDNFSNAIRITGTRFHVTVTNTGATKESGEPNHRGNLGGSSLWYSWTAPISGRVSLSTNEIAAYAPPSWEGDYVYGSESIIEVFYDPDCGDAVDQSPPPVFYPLIAAYIGNSVSTLTSNYLPIGLDAYPYGIEFDAVQGRKYYFACDGNMGTTGIFPLYLALTRPAMNDVFARRILVQGNYVAISGYNAGSHLEAHAPDIGNGSTGKISWWSWRAPVDGLTTINLTGSDYSFPVAVFVGGRISTLTNVAAGAGSLSFTAKLGQTYQIAVGDAGGLTGEIKMVLQAPLLESPLMDWHLAPSGKSLLMHFEAAPGQVLQLQHAMPTNWQNLQKAVARHNNNAAFVVNPGAATNLNNYRAVIVNYIPQ